MIDLEELTFLPWIGILTLPNVIAQLIPLLKRKNTAPLMSYFYSIFLNIGYGLLIDSFTHKKLRFIAIIVLVCTWILILVPCALICCPTDFNGNTFVIREMGSNTLKGTRFTDKIARNRAYPPTVIVGASAYHYEKRNEYDSLLSILVPKRVKVTTWEGRATFKYASWEEIGNPIRLGKAKIYQCVFEPVISCDESAVEGYSRLVLLMKEEALTHDRYVELSSNNIINGLCDHVCGTNLEEPPFVMKFYQSCFAIFIWAVFVFIGYQSSFESFWCAASERVVMKLKKKISMNPNQYRCGFNQEDVVALQTTFRSEDGMEYVSNLPLIEGNFDDYFSQYQPVNAIDINQFDQLIPQASPSAENLHVEQII